LRKGLLAILLISLLFSWIAVPTSSATNCVMIAVQDSRGVYIAKCDIYAQMDILGAPKFIGNTGKTTWLGWCDFVSAPLGFPYKLVAKIDGHQVGSKIVFLTGAKPENIIIPMTNEKSDLGGINFTSIKLNYSL
jgi:hypothetical protein